MTINTIALKDQWEALKQEFPKMRIRNAAEKLNVSEAQLLATQCGENVTRLEVDFKEFFKTEIPKLGRVKAITRNDDVVHERVGEYLNPGFNPKSPVGLFVGEEIDLRIFLSTWKFTFAVTEMVMDRPRYSLQFFDVYGNALHKIYLISKSNFDAFLEISKKYKATGNCSDLDIDPFVESEDYPTDDDTVDIATFQQEWIELKDTHDFFGLLKRHKVSRTKALEIAPTHEGIPYAVKVENNTLRTLLHQVAGDQTPIMVFVGNKGIIQIHTGEINKVMDFEDWLNVMDPDFNLHVKEPQISASWIVRKPTTDGFVTSLELFNPKNELICTVFGKRKPGIPEDKAWQETINALAK